MKKISYIFSIIIISVVTVHAQSAFASQNASATAYLVVPLSIEATLGDLDFGSIILTGSSSTEVLDPSNGKLFVVSGHPRRNVTFTFDSVTMDNAAWVISSGGQLDNLEFVPQVELKNGNIIHSGDSKKLKRKNGIGELDVWVGGSIKVSANQSPGDYTGRFTLFVSY